MTGGRFGPLQLSVCLPCGGAWFSREDLSRLLGGGPEAIRRLAERLGPPVHARNTLDATERAPARCPHCAVPLASTPEAALPEVRLDHCHFCKFYWIGSDALARMAVLLAPPSEPPPAPRPAPTLREAVAPSSPVPQPPPPPAFAGQPAGVPPSAGARVAPRASVRAPVMPTVPKPERVGPVPPRVPCPQCGEKNEENAAVCWACGKVLRGVVIGTCPRCAGSLHEVESRGVTIGACDGCGGVWAEEGTLDALLHQPEEQREAVIRQVVRIRTGRIRKLAPGLMCPKCELIMPRAPMMVSAEPLDTCPGCCATFLDEGVLAILLRSGEVW